MPSFRGVIAYFIVTFFVLYVFVATFGDSASSSLSSLSQTILGDDSVSDESFPDFSKYVFLQTLSNDKFPIDDPNKRTIIIGDIHGMYDELQTILKKLSYDPRVDTFVSVGDILAKGPHSGSLNVLSFMSSNNITAVRGNHDQKALEWRSWLNWIRDLSGGKKWLKDLDERFIKFQSSLPKKDREDEDLIETWVEKQEKIGMKRSGGHRKWWNRVPHGWKMYGDHYRIALAMSDKEYDYLASRPLRIHVPHAHAFIVHAGLLASDPTKAPAAVGQPLATVPILPESQDTLTEPEKALLLRTLQETAILEDIPQNMDPYLVENMRSVSKEGEVSRSKDGTPWSDLYKRDMSYCVGFDSPSSAQFRKKTSLPCYPTTVIYGHAASRGLDIKRWTLGLDSGCVYDRRLTTLVLGGKYARTSQDFEDEEDLFNNDGDAALGFDDEDDEYGPEFGAFDRHNKKHKSIVRFGDYGRGRLVSIPCS